jgi:hypothetical protein
MKRPRGACCLVAVSLVAVLVQDVTAQTRETGIGSTSCAQFANLYKESPEGTESVFYSWAMGVMAGMNISLREERANSALYVEAVRDLYAVLRRKQSLPPWQLSRQRNR